MQFTLGSEKLKWVPDSGTLIRVGIYNPQAISIAYQRVCLKSKWEAADSGLRDERFICKEFGPLEPTGIKLPVNKSNHNNAN
jgi:hypothetical protein